MDWRKLGAKTDVLLSVFLGIVLLEVVIIMVQFSSDTLTLSLPLVYLLITNIIAFVLFLSEGILLRKKMQPEK